jgi:hypothetical protein
LRRGRVADHAISLLTTVVTTAVTMADGIVRARLARPATRGVTAGRIRLLPRAGPAPPTIRTMA